MKLILFLWLLTGPAFHDIQVAFFKIHQDDQNVYIEFVFEQEDIIQTFKESSYKNVEDGLQAYLRSNFSLSINNEEKRLVFSEFEIKNKHIYLQGVIPNTTQTIKSVSIENSCLINIEDHSNIIEVRLQGKQRDFLMNIERTSIQINY